MHLSLLYEFYDANIDFKKNKDFFVFIILNNYRRKMIDGKR